MRILLLKSLFIPSESFMNINLSSLENFIRYFKSVHIEGKLIIKLIGWISSKISDKDRDRIRKKLKEISENVNTPLLEPRRISDSINITAEENLPKLSVVLETEIWGGNYGKIYLLKNIGIIYPMYRMCNYILYADHDISPIDNILCSKVMLDNYINDRKIKLVSYNQYPDNRHNPLIYTKVFESLNERYYYCDDNIGIASGCFIIKPDIVNLFKKLQSNNIYGDEDIMIGKALNGAGYQNIVSSLRVNHPYNDDAEYEQWKKDIIKKIIQDENNNGNNQ